MENEKNYEMFEMNKCNCDEKPITMSKYKPLSYDIKSICFFICYLFKSFFWDKFKDKFIGISMNQGYWLVLLKNVIFFFLN